MAERTQDYASHRRWNPWYHFVVLPLLLANIVFTVRHVWGDWTTWNVWQIVACLAIAGAAAVARSQVLRVQDRAIRLEMRVRLHDMLPVELRSRISELRARQLIGLRFASDEELPALVRKCLSGELATSGAVKRAIRHWQPDWLRA